MHALLLIASLVVASPADDAREALLADELHFAESLARHRYFDLALAVADQTHRAIESLDDARDLAGEAELIEARILQRRADSLADPVERMAALDKAIAKLGDWTGPGSNYAYHDRLVDALDDLAGLLSQRGQLRARAAAEGEADAAQAADEDFQAAEATYRAMREEAEGLAEQYAELDQVDKAAAMRVRAVNTWYFQGLNAVEWADVANDPELRLESAYEQLDEFLWDAEENLLYWFATFEQGRVAGKLGDLDDARGIIAENVLQQAGAEFWDYVETFPPAQQAIIASLFDKAWGYLARLEAGAGEMDEAQRWIDTMLSEHKSKGVPVGREGFDVLIEWARTLEGLGRLTEATDIVKLVSDQGKGTPEGQIAEVMLTELVKGGNIESPAVLLAAARGSRSEKKYDDAAYYYLKAGALLGSGDAQAEEAYEAWTGAGDALRRQNRHLESAIAYEQAIAAAQRAELPLDDLEAAARGFYNGFERRYKETGDDFDKGLREQASQRLIAMDGVELDLAFMSATEAFSELEDGDVAGHLAVKAEFEGVPSSSPNYERALVYVARCLEGAGRFDEAVAAYAVVTTRSEDPSLEPTNADARNKREIALAQARYFEATLLLDESVNRPADALAVLEDFETDVAGQDSFHDLAKLRRIEAYAMLGDTDAAEAELERLVSGEAPTASVLAGAAYRTAQALEQAARDSDDPSEADALLGRAADALMLYAEADGYSSPVNVMGAGDWYLEVGRNADAEAVFERALEVMDRQGSAPERVERGRIGLATALDAQLDFGRSRTLWKELLTLNPKSVAIRTGAALCFGGWLRPEDDGTSMTEIGGSGDYEDAVEIWAELLKGTNAKSKYTRLWWEAKLGTIWCYYKMKNLKPDAVLSARKILDNLKLSQPNYDADTIDQLEEDQRYEPLFRDRFRYLDRQIQVP